MPSRKPRPTPFQAAAYNWLARPEMSGTIVMTADRATPNDYYYLVDTGTATGSTFNGATPNATLGRLAAELLRFAVEECGEKPATLPTLKQLTLHLTRLREQLTLSTAGYNPP